MTQEWVTETLDELTAWGERRSEQVDLHGAEILLGLVDELGLEGPGALDAVAVRGILLEDLPDQVAASPDQADSILRTFGSLVDFLAERGTFSAERAAELRSELGTLGADLREALAAAGHQDEQAFSEIVFRMMSDEGVDLDSEEAVDAWLKSFGELPAEEQAARTAPYLADAMEQLDELLLPAVRLADDVELAEAARESKLLIDAVALVDWVGERELTETDVLSGSETAAAIAALGLATPRADLDLDGAEPEDLDDVPELARLWDAAVTADLLVIEDGRAKPGSMLHSVKDGDREALLDTWIALLDDVVTVEAEDHSDHDHDHHDHDHDHESAALTPYEAVRDALPGVLLHLYEQERPTPRAVLLDALTEHLLGAFEVSGREAKEWRAAGGAAFELELADLASWGVIEGDPEGYALTPLGLWGVRELLIADGYVAPLVGDLAEFPADVLVAGLVAHREDTVDEEIDLWLGRREPIPAATELLAAMREGTPGTRNLASAVLDRLDAVATPAVREALEDRATRPYAALWLQQRGEPDVTLTPTEITWLFIDTVAGLLETTEPDVAITTALSGAPTDVDLKAMIEDMWRADHPDIAQVLEALGDHHPDREVAKSARRAAYKARS